MIYSAYRAQTNRAAGALADRGGRVVSLAGGYFGVQVPADGAHVILALDLDGVTLAPEWVAWREDSDGERCCDAGAVIVGACRPRDFASLADRAFRAVAAHRCH